MSEKIFISYSHIDLDLVAEVARLLEELGVEYFLDKKDVDWGADIPTAVGGSLAECSSILVIISPASLKSHWVPYEVGLATAMKKRILPFLVHPSLDLPGYLQNYHHKTR